MIIHALRLTVLLLAILTSPSIKADEAHQHGLRPDAHAPIGVMGDHTHKAGELMVSYRYMDMLMDDNLNDSDDLVDSTIVSPDGFNFMVVPTEMTMAMHMVGVMYGVNDKLTLMAMAGFIDNSMDHLTRMGGTFTTSADGVGDVKLAALYQLSNQENTSLVLNLGWGLANGSIDEQDLTPMSGGNPAQLPYPMQIGSGSNDVHLGFTFQQWHEDWSWGNQVRYTHRLDENDRGYTLGDQFHVTSWISKIIAPLWSASLRINYQERDNIDGADSSLNPAVVQTANIDLQGYNALEVAVGLNTSIAAHRFALEYLTPVWQHVDGPQLTNDRMIQVGWQLAF